MYGKLKLEITCADSAFLLNAFSAAGVKLEDVSYLNNLTIGVTVNYDEYSVLRNICDRQGASVKFITRTGFQFVILSVLKRPVLVLFACVIFVISVFLPSRILFVSVEGNNVIAKSEILEAAEKCGIVFGANRRQVRSEKMKNALLQEIPELQWAGINTFGCTAIISVKEKTKQNISANPKSQVSSIVATRDGIIQDCIVYQGNSLCSVGQAVKKGQVLVSGYTDCGIVTKATQADAEIKALTFREMEVISPNAALSRGVQKKEITRYSVRIGKKLIKLYKDSGNYDATCAKIYVESYAQLPGGFLLPIVLVKESLCNYDTTVNQENFNNKQWLAIFSEEYLHSTMIAGNIVSSDTQVSTIDSATVLLGKYVCLEMIGQVKYEQMMIEGE